MDTLPNMPQPVSADEMIEISVNRRLVMAAMGRAGFATPEEAVAFSLLSLTMTDPSIEYMRESAGAFPDHDLDIL
jgi:hypothetical protein